MLFLGVDMEAQKSLRNSGFLPALAADRVYDHNGAVFSTVRHAGRAQERPAPVVSARLLSKKKTSQSKAWLTWLSLLPLAALEITKIRSCETHEAGMSLSLLPGLSLRHRRCFHLAVAREMARLMQQSPKLPFVEPAFAGPEQVSIACPKLSAGLKLRLSSGTNRPSRSSRRAVLQWVAVAL